MIKRWQKIASRTVADFRIFQLREDTSLSPRTGADYRFFVLDTPDWINILPLTRDGEAILIRQYRHGTEEVTLEIPGGMVDVTDKSPALSAQRELLEETGYMAEEIIHLGSVAPNPAILSNSCHTYLALNVRQISQPQLDGAEDIEIEIVKAEDLPYLVTSGQITHALTIAAFYFYERYRQNRDV